MYGWDTLVVLKDYLDQGLSKTAIAQRLGVSRRLIYHWLETGQLDRDLSAPPGPRQPTARATKLDRFHALIAERLRTYPELSAVRLLDECRADGYRGGYSQLKAHVAQVRPQPEPEPIVRFETAPGLQAQFDFARGPLPLGQAVRGAGRAGLLAVALRRVRRAADGAHRDARPGACVRRVRRRAAGDSSSTR